MAREEKEKEDFEKIQIPVCNGAVNSSPLTPLDFLDIAAAFYGDCTSIIYNNHTFTWSLTHHRCLKLASSLCSLGIGRGDVVSVVAPNIPAMYELQFAVPFTGAVLNNISTRLDDKKMSGILRHAQPKLVFVDYMSRSQVLTAISSLPPEAQRPILVFVTDDSIKPTSSEGFSHSYEELVENGDTNFQWIRPKSEWDPMVLNYKFDTTSSSPKGVVHCHRGTFVTTVSSLISWAVPKHLVFLWSTLYMFDVNGWSFPWGIAAMGGTNICVRDFDVDSVFPLIKRHGVTHMCAEPTILNMMINSSAKEDLERPVQVLTVGAPPPAAVLCRAEALKFVVSPGYGLTETGGVVVPCAWKPGWNWLPAMERARLKARQGVRAIGLAEKDVVHPDSGKSVKRDGSTLGEVVLRGNLVMLGYLKDPAANSECFKNGWFHTGNLGVIHPNGFLEIKDRMKDVINVGDERVSSVDVENVLYELPEVKEAAVVARPDDSNRSETTVCAFVVLWEGLEKKPTQKDIIEHCKASIRQETHFMVPKTVVFKEDLPKTWTGKIQKSELRKEARDMGSPEAKMTRLEGPQRRKVIGLKISTDMRRSNMNIKICPKFPLAKPRATLFTVHANSGRSLSCMWL